MTCGIVFEVGLIAAQAVIANLAGAWPKIGDEDPGIVAALAPDDFSAGQGIDSAEPGLISRGEISSGTTLAALLYALTRP